MNPTTSDRVDTSQSHSRFLVPRPNIALHIKLLPIPQSSNCKSHLKIAILAIILIALWTQCVASHVNKHDTKSRLRFQSLLEEMPANVDEDNLIPLDEHVFKHLTESVPISDDSTAQSRQLHSPTHLGHNQSQVSTMVHSIWEEQLELSEVDRAWKHLQYIRSHFSCSSPRPKLVRVKDIHGTANKAFIPRCTVLHRCDDDTGCCEDPRHTCQPERTEMVELYFHVVRSDKVNNITGGNGVEIERLTFLNHTKCACRPINYQPRNSQPTRHPTKTYFKERHPQATTTNWTHGKQTRDIHHKCKDVIKKCPEPFVKRFREVDRRCVCECFSPHKTDQYDLCQRIKSGTAQLDEFWARCVRREDCAKPECNIDFDYSKDQSRCLAGNRTRANIHSTRHRHHHLLYSRHRRRHVTTPDQFSYWNRFN